MIDKKKHWIGTKWKKYTLAAAVKVLKLIFIRFEKVFFNQSYIIHINRGSLFHNKYPIILKQNNNYTHKK